MDEHCRQGEGKSVYESARREAEWLIWFATYIPAIQAIDREDDDALHDAAVDFFEAWPDSPLGPHELAKRLRERAITRGAPKLSIKPGNRIAEYYAD